MNVSSVGTLLLTVALAPLSAHAEFFTQAIDFTDQTLASQNEGNNCSTQGVNGCNKSADILFDLTTVGYTPGTALTDWSVTLFLVDDEDSSSGPESSGSWTNASSGSYQANERLRAIFSGVNFNEFNGLNNGAEDLSDTGRTEFTVTNLDTFESTTAAQVDGVFTGIQGNGKLKAVYQTFAGDMIIQSATLSVNTPVTAVPVPASAWLMASALLGLVGVRKRRQLSIIDVGELSITACPIGTFD